MTVKPQNRAYARRSSVVFYKTTEAFGGLSNMAAGFPVRVNGILIPTSEALFQACQFPQRPELQQLIIDQKSPMTAKMKGKPHRLDIRADWEKIKIGVMRWCLRVKLVQQWTRFGELLRSTGERPIIEESRKDDFWGAIGDEGAPLEGQNVLGRLLMELRCQLLAPNAAMLRIVDPPAVPDFLLGGQPIGRITYVSGGSEVPAADLFPISMDEPEDAPAVAAVPAPLALGAMAG